MNMSFPTRTNLALLFLLSFVSISQYAKPPKYSNDFMYIGVGAHNFGVGNAVVANTNDITAGYWNPAGLTNIKTNIQFSFMHNEYFSGLAKYDYAGIAFPLDSNKHAFAINFLRFGVDNIPNTLDLIDADGTVNYDNVRNFSVGNYGILLSYARKIIPGLSLGLTAKIVHNKAGGFAKSWGFGVDVGAIYQIKDWKIGLTVKDITTTFNAWQFSFTDKEKLILESTDNIIPKSSTEITLPRIQLGVAYNKSVFKNKIDISAEIDFEMTTDGKRNTLISSKAVSIDPRIGIEIGLWKIVYLRGGVNNFQKMFNDAKRKSVFTVSPNIGVGIRFKSYVSVDYSYTDVGKTSENQYSHVVSFVVGLNKRKRKENAELINVEPIATPTITEPVIPTEQSAPVITDPSTPK